MRQIVENLFDEMQNNLQEVLSDEIRNTYRLIEKNEALKAIHFPKSQEALARAQYRMKFEELFFVQLQLGLKKQHRKERIKGIPFPKIGSYFNRFFHDHLPFPLTEAQKRVVREIRT